MFVHHLPTQPMPFVGRNRELTDIAALLRDPTCRLLTLVGPGGIGKTRLAGEAAGASEQFAQGVFYITLQSLNTSDSIIPALIDALECQYYSGNDPKAYLLDYLAEKNLLLVLDNFEHLLDAAPLVSELLTAAPDMKVLATSRERLNIRDEWVFEVGGLSLPTKNDAAEIGDYSAVQLFVQNARRVDPGFTLADNAAAVARICTLLDGLPLALELASSWVRVLSCTEIAQEIERGLDILETSARDVPPRHRNMRAVLDYSWHSLSEAEQDAFRRLAVFRGGFSREAAQVVAGATLPILASLVDKSWLQHDSSAGRYGLHELLGQYARERLEQSGLAEQTLDAHMHYYAGFMNTRESGIKYRRQSESLVEIEQDFENVRLAWKRAAVCGDNAIIDQMAETLNFFCDMRARFNEGVSLFTYAADAFAVSQSGEAILTFIRLRARYARQAILGAGLPEDELDLLVEEMTGHLKRTREYQSPKDIAFLLYMLGIAKSVTCDFEAGLACFSESLDIYTELNDSFYMAEELVWVGLSQSDFRATADYFRRALALQRDIDDQNGIGWTLIDLARTAFTERKYSEAQHYLDEAIAMQRRRRDLKGLHNSLIMSSQRALRLGDFDTALALAQESAEIAGNLSLPPIKQASKMVVGVLHILLEIDVAGGKQLCEEALALTVPNNLSCGDPELDATQGLFMAAFINGDLDEMRCQYAHLVDLLPIFGIHLPVDQFELLAPLAIMLLTSQGQPERAVELLSFTLNLSDASEKPVKPVMNWLDGLPLTMRVRDDLRQCLDDQVYEAAWQRGQSLDLHKTVHELMSALYLAGASEIVKLISTNIDSLTERELEVLHLVAEGLSNREIATRLYLALGTVKWYISEVYSKLGVTSRTQAVARARERQLIA